MNKNKRIRTFLISNPGYLKKSAKWLQENVFGTLSIEYIAKVLKEEKSNSNPDNLEWKNPDEYTKAIDKSKDFKVVKKSFAEIFPFSKDSKKRDVLVATPIIVDKTFVKNQVKKIEVKSKGFDKNNVLIIGDTHEPFCKKGYLEHCLKVQKDYNCGTVIHIGDLVDNHAVSYHDHDPDGKSPNEEYIEALENCKKWYEAFPDVLICIGNHDRLPFRKAYTAGLPKNWLKSYQEMFNSPKGWKWDFVHRVNGVIYQHGTGMSGEMASVNACRENRQSTVIGHLHTVSNIRFLASHKDLIFGMSVGCGIDHTKYAFAYGKENTRKPVLGCGVVIGGKLPINIPMFI